MTRQDLMPDRLGAYRLLKRIGEGGMGVVFLARSPGRESVALKVLRSAVAGEPTARRRLAREVETMQRVRSPYVAEVIDADLEGDLPYIVTRYVAGRTLDQVVSEGGPITGPALARLASGLAEALVAVHAAGVVHRDLKPSNVMLLNGSPVVIDFGIAQGPDATRLTMTGMFMGTPGYLAPEVIEGQPSSEASDVHAWGATVAFAAIGHPPYGTGSYEGIFYRIVNGQPDLAAVPAALLPLLWAALARDPSRRPAALALAAQASVLDPASFTAAGGVAAAGPGAAAARLGPAGVTRAEASPAGQFPGGPGMGMAGLDAAGLGGAGGLDGLGGANGLGGAPGVAGAAGLGGAAISGGGPAGTASGQDGAALAPGVLPGAFGPGTRPLNTVRPLPEDLADVLPPVRYQPGGAAGRPGTAPSASGRLAAGLGADPAATRARSNPLLVLASMVVAASVSVILPVAGTLASLALIVTLRAAGLAQRRGAQRRARGSRSSDPVVAVMAFPWYLIRALLAILLLSPFALAVAVVVAGVSVALVPADWPARSLAYAAGALVAFYGLGPGSRTARGQLRRVFTSVATTRTTQVVALAGITVLAVAALTAAVSWPSAYWPAVPPGSVLHIGVIHLGPWHRVGLLRHFGIGHRFTLLRRLVMHRLGQLHSLAG